MDNKLLKTFTKDDYLVHIYDDVDILTNVLRSLVTFRSKYPEYWPQKLVVHERNRLSISCGSDIEIVRANWPLLDALYISLFNMQYDPTVLRVPRNLASVTGIRKREPILDTNRVMYRFRQDLHNVLLVGAA